MDSPAWYLVVKCESFWPTEYVNNIILNMFNLFNFLELTRLFEDKRNLFAEPIKNIQS